MDLDLFSDAPWPPNVACQTGFHHHPAVYNGRFRAVDLPYALGCQHRFAIFPSEPSTNLPMSDCSYCIPHAKIVHFCTSVRSAWQILSAALAIADWSLESPNRWKSKCARLFLRRHESEHSSSMVAIQELWKVAKFIHLVWYVWIRDYPIFWELLFIRLNGAHSFEREEVQNNRQTTTGISHKRYRFTFSAFVLNGE